MPTKDPEKKRANNQRWYKANRERELEKSRQWHRENRDASNASNRKYKQSLRDLINEYKKAGVCVRCGVGDYRILDFHHIDPAQKKFELNTGLKKSMGARALLDEIAKCELVCANCHRLLHWEEENTETSPA
jgi:hypothetical protein